MLFSHIVRHYVFASILDEQLQKIQERGLRSNLLYLHSPLCNDFPASPCRVSEK